jgi:hypothetical protein
MRPAQRKILRPYVNEQPNKRIPEDKAPRRKHFNPASVEISDIRFEAANT